MIVNQNYFGLGNFVENLRPYIQSYSSIPAGLVDTKLMVIKLPPLDASHLLLISLSLRIIKG